MIVLFIRFSLLLLLVLIAIIIAWRITSKFDKDIMKIDEEIFGDNIDEIQEKVNEQIEKAEKQHEVLEEISEFKKKKIKETRDKTQIDKFLNNQK